MMTFRSSIFYVCLLIASMMVCKRSYGQEALVGLNENSLLTKALQNLRPLVKSPEPPLEIPFVDDFAQSSTSPDFRRWSIYESVFVNSTYSINSPTIGAATFDPFDSKGRIYSHASQGVFPADTLESREINLNYSPSDSIYLTFFVQPQGYGDMPEANDTFALEFYSPDSQTWTPVWSASASVGDSTLTLANHLQETHKTLALKVSFYRIDIKISEPAYLLSGFRFRFVNYASISVHPDFPGRSTACDHWHLDFVYLDRGRSMADARIPDIALTKAQAPLSTIYESVPARHFDKAKADLFGNPTNLEITYVNLGWGTKSVTRNFRFRSLYGVGNTVSHTGGSENVHDGEIIPFSYAVPQYDFSIPDDSGAFEIRSWLVSDSDPSPFRRALRANDTTIYVHKFHDYYAYDDGTAENGYGLFGSGTAGGRVAVKFYNYETDSLRGAYMYFNRALNEANVHDFLLAVWDDKGDGTPGELIHYESGARPVFKDSLNRFVAYRFSKPVFISKGQNYYLGWIQTGENFLNIGFDRNRNHRDKAFYNIGQGWEQSIFDGSLMLRPIFCRTAENFPDDSENLSDEQEQRSSSRGYSAYPNPTKGLIYLTENDSTPMEASRVNLYDLSGHLVKSFPNVSGNIDLSTLATGIYLMLSWDKNGESRETKRIIVE
jgi:hypothetical protein